MNGKLYIIATPIGNLADITLRAIETLKSVDLIACEDTRVSKKLLDHYEITTKLISYHQHSGQTKVVQIIDELKAGKDLAVITDAGTPGISDPGNKLVADVISQLGDEVQIIPIPGPSALISALSISGLPTDRFLFLGFLPHKKGKDTMLKQIIESKITTIFYESTHRIMKSLSRLDEMFDAVSIDADNDRKIVVGRELTKKFETIYRGTIKEVIEKLNNDKTRGEFVVVVSGR
ncbi:MAG TPA: 16S rRNA (cytidine(1402)-2'-O)-methyltransferase [Patescibacteria group bacterium]|nr:16S rRNA (cytidine(1402)-2'-O)-methyltransferase [Patescibacteria group bacterium]